MEIRRLTPADAPAWRELRLRALREQPEAFTSSWEDEARRPIAASQERLGAAGVAFWGAWDGAQLCGMVGLERPARPKELHKGKVVGMAVAPEFAGRGIGRDLLAALVAHAHAAGLRLLVLTVTEGNGGAIRLYERAGFQSFGVEPQAIRVGERFHGKTHMALLLGEPA